ncbi:hypothetical protein JOB18_041411 [Solea senegalensis]|uniref:Reelin domain-containing protein n=1 Tax=Solea senegalensis TaxID=28829 RepID=A0AAV6TAW0_SOLSE|nr:ferric-chelate reductase 1-like [Solea senegalensis]KAG7526523.1 hypothetical protein JOB18_041411 [Solea senegalensis]
MSPSAFLSLFAVLCMCGVQQCLCFPNGSVAYSCAHMIPGHPPYKPSNSNPPFTVSTSRATYRPGGVITVTLEVNNSSSSYFEGFLLQARSKDENALLWPVGKFTNINTTMFTALHCKDIKNSTVSQATGAKKKKVELTWEAPSNSNHGDIYFSATLVQDYRTFWVQLNSSSVRRDTSSATGVISSSVFLFISLLILIAFS